jgi:hypothetical protein
MTDQEREMDLALAECEAENKLLRAKNERLEKERAWVSLTKDDILAMLEDHDVYTSKWVEFARSVETKLREKNAL